MLLGLSWLIPNPSTILGHILLTDEISLDFLAGHELERKRKFPKSLQDSYIEKTHT